MIPVPGFVVPLGIRHKSAFAFLDLAHFLLVELMLSCCEPNFVFLFLFRPSCRSIALKESTRDLFLLSYSQLLDLVGLTLSNTNKTTYTSISPIDEPLVDIIADNLTLYKSIFGLQSHLFSNRNTFVL